MRIKLLLGLIVVGLVVGSYRAGTVALREALQDRLSSTLGRPVAIKSMDLAFPAGMNVIGLTVEPSTVNPAVALELHRLRIDWKGPSKGFVYQGQGELKNQGGQRLASLQVVEGSCVGGLRQARLLLEQADLENWQPYLSILLGVPPPTGKFRVVSEVTLFDDTLTAQNQLTATDVVFSTEEPTVLGPTGNQIVRLLRDPEGKVRFSFVVKGRWAADFDWSEHLTAALRGELSKAVAQSIQQTLSDTEQTQLLEEMIRSSLEAQ